MAITKGKKVGTTARAAGTKHSFKRKVSGRVKGKSQGEHLKRGSESWETRKWLIGKKLAHVVKEKLIADFRPEDSSELPEGRRARFKRASKQSRRPKPRRR